MNIQYYGDYCFKISTKPAGRATEDIVIWTDLLEKGSGLRSPQGEADIVFLTHGDIEGTKAGLKGTPITLSTPGEYAVKGIAAQGFLSFRDNQEGKELGQNTIFIFESEEIHVAFLGALGHDLSPELLDKLNGVDILFLPIGGAGAMAPKIAAELARKIEPNVIIPMHYKLPGLLFPLETEKAFCDALGSCPTEVLSKFNVKKKDLEEQQLKIILLERGI